MTLQLQVAPRTTGAEAVRSAGSIPGIVYGPKQEPISIQIAATTLEKVVHQAGESTIITLDGLEQPIDVLVHDVAFNAKQGGIEHIDFYAIEKGKELTAHVSFEFIGEAPAVKLGGTVTKALHGVDVTCRPADLPAHLTVDLSSLVDEESQIKVKDIDVPKGVTVDAEPEEVIALISAAREEEEDEGPGEVDMDAVAVEAKGKEEPAE